MKLHTISRIFFTFVLVLLGASTAVPMPVQAQAADPTGERITSYDVDIQIATDSTVTVRESLTYDFGANSRHGIIRDIPVRFDNWFGRSDLRFRLLQVIVDGQEVKPYKTWYGDDQWHVQIGDPDIEISGAHQYVIEYRVVNGLSFLEDSTEIYWNAIGDQWLVPITNISVNVQLPTPAPVRATCFAGPRDSRDKCDYSGIAGASATSTNSVAFTQALLSPNSALTVVVNFPAEIVTQPAWWVTAAYFLLDNLGYLVIAIFAVMAVTVWWLFGRDVRGAGVIIPQYDAPATLTPAQVGYLADFRVDQSDVSAEIISLAVKGYLKIHYVADTGLLSKLSKTDNYILTLEKPADDKLAPHQKLLLESLFLTTFTKDHQTPSGSVHGVRLSDLTNSFYVHLNKVQAMVSDGMIKDGYVDQNNGWRTFLVFAAIIMGIVGFASSSASPLAIPILFAVFVVFFVMIVAMAKRTAIGVAAKEHILGLKQYLSVAEKDRLEFHNAPAKKPEVFEQLLPYAMVLGVATSWAKQFTDVYQKPPQWYSGPVTSFNAVNFSHSLSSFSTAAGSSVSSRPSSSSGGGSGGSSGGGGGGGGGGSW